MKPFTVLRAKTAVLPQTNIDTDRIIPARFLKTVDKRGLGGRVFFDWRRDQLGRLRPDFPLNRPQAAGAEVLVAGDNFGCGSSREHAPWALLDSGVRAVVSTRIADIFSQNALKTGLLPVIVDHAFHGLLTAREGETVEIDLRARTIAAAGETHPFTVDPFARVCLLEGQDHLDHILDQRALIDRFEEAMS